MSNNPKKDKGKAKKKAENNNDIDEFFEKFDQISNDYKKNNSSPKNKIEGIPSDVASSAFSEKKVVADRSRRFSKSGETPSINNALKNKSISTDNAGKDMDIKDLNDIFENPEVGGIGADSTGEAKKDGGLLKVADNLKRKIKKGSNSKKRKKRKRNGTKKDRRKKWLKRIIAACGILAVIGIIMVAFILQDTQKINYNNIYEYLAESSIIYDDEGEEIESIYSGEGSRVIVDYEDMPKDLVNAFVAIEDKTFWDHHGFNFVRLLGAVWESISGQGRVGGTSTITQQLARNLWLAESKSSRGLAGLERKIKEAYYAIQLERHLSKDQILEAYLNTIALGQNSLGVQAASQTYFSKDVQDLDLLESAALASLPQAPTTYSYIKTVDKGEVSKDDPNFITQGKVNTYLYNDEAEWRVQLVLDYMNEQGYINTEQHDETLISELRDRIEPNLEDQSDEAQFFVDYTINNLTKDLMAEYNYSEQDATQMVYSGGLRIYTTLNKKMQDAIEEEFKDNSNFPGVTNLNRDSSGNILNENGSVILYKYSNFFDSKGNFTLKDSEFTLEDNGDILLKKGERLNFYEVENDGVKDINIEFKDLYLQEDGVFYSIDGGVVSVPAQYKKLDSDGNLIIDSSFMKDRPDFMDVSDDEITISNTGYSLRQQVQQPQSSMVILDHSNGQVKAMVGGRSIEGKMNYNRATSPRQPGSSIKPIGAYGPAIEMGAEGERITNGESSFGTYWTAASVIVDEEMTYQGRVWPKNWYSGYKGPMTLRKAVEQSVNTTAVKVLNNIGTERSTEFLKALGVTTVVEDGNTNDMNAAALALGGMTNGISPIEMASAYGTFANEGVHVDATSYTEIRNKDGKLVLESSPDTNEAMDEGTAFIMTDILKSVVSDGIAQSADVSGHTIAGKTGTTTDNYDAWFVGMTGQYSASLWIGNDVNIELSEGSAAAARLWSNIMSKALEGEDNADFPDQPSNVSKQTVSGVSEYFIDGTAPSSLDLSSEKVNLCVDSGYLGTPWCPVVQEKTFTSIYTGNGSEDSAPTYYCNLHNLDVDQFPIDPKQKLDTTFGNPQEEEEEKEPEPPPIETNEPVQPTEPTQPTSPTGLGLNSVFSTASYISSVPVYEETQNQIYSLNRFYNSDILGSIYNLEAAL